ncbi:Ger(x)C family spore germination protein [Fictibacillus phosphorivorans]|uniref:Ger(x)C family spore germination protein n=1 Tax=Fictibacillus phosphorivorans TaxID=1221500 RepID=UPI0012939611|nr:Ger(x)C family spore germination protein [Fictibacillus phosphorivorans]MQR97565.1 Ger(x)C family spore germination protein [Fictibacillus phosphorivorans]
MQKLIKYIVASSLLFLSGCWDHAELTEYVFVQSLAIDQKKDGRIKLTTQFYKPAPKIASAGGGGESYFELETEAKSVFDAIRDVTIHLGRKANWGHVRFIVISEKVARKQYLGSVLDFFFRDHEPRLLTGVAVTEGPAADYIKEKPHVENTVSEQLNEVTKTGSKFSAKTYPANLFTIGKQLHSEVDTVYLPYIKKEKEKENSIFVDGLSLFQGGKLKTIISNKETKSLMLALNDFQFGIISITCKGSKLQESFEITESHTNSTFEIKKGVVHYSLQPKLQASIGELECSTIQTKPQLEALHKKLEKQVNHNLMALLKQSQKKNIDIIGLGNHIYRSNPREWQRIKKEKVPYYKDAVFHVKSEVNILNTGTDISKPFHKKY